MLLPISSLDDLVSAFPTNEYTYEISGGNGTAGKTLSLVVRPFNTNGGFAIRIAEDLIKVQDAKPQSKLRFALCDEDKTRILQNPDLLRLTPENVFTLNTTDISKQLRRSHGLLGQSFLVNSASIKYKGCELYVNPSEYAFPASFSELAITVGKIRVELHDHLPDNFNNWEDDDHEYEDDERDDE